MSNVRSSSRRSAVLLLVSLMAAAPLLTGCLERSTTVGDRYSGTIVVATSPDNPRGAPKLDVPESMGSSVTLSDYSTRPESETTAAPGSSPTQSPASPGASAAPDNTADKVIPRVGTRAVFTDLTAGQFSQLGDIVAASFGESAMSMDLSAKRSGDVVRFRGSADLTDLTPNRDFVELTVTFGGPVSATNGDQISDTTVTWTPEPRKPSDFSADATYPDPATAAVSSWSWFFALVCLAAVAIVGWLAYLKRDRSPRPGRPRRSGPTRSKSSTKSGATEPETTTQQKSGSGSR
ncbi:LppM family (lipo)protein [Gordonia hankookensis]|uniref:DUF3153 domain-containing protein n=1 Tax=Gordonia hankookensis TaxID=589403 RepID=A0ABR7W5J9_9ACTN|nr:DUF3153 domain-containing protein [Gordonia hankookensis]MBD1318114.1 DUF3153 domain-containing protein [Gordonia hankookensis]